jgi:hypothetical protein
LTLSASRTASVFVYATNLDSTAKTVSFSASSNGGLFELYYDYYDSSLAPRAARGATLHVTAPPNMRGCDSITVTATVCGANGGACETQSRSIRVDVQPSGESSYYIAGQDYCGSYYEPALEPAGKRVYSRIEYAGYFDATNYEARFIDRPTACERVRPGEAAVFRASLLNAGAATSFDIRLLGDKDVLNAGISNSFVSLQRSEVAELSVSVSPTHYAAPGRYYVEVQAQRNGVTLASRDVCVEVEHSYGVRLSAPREVDATTCGIASFNAELENTGTGNDVFGIDVSEPDWALVETQSVNARGGQKQIFEVKIDGTRLATGVYRLGIKAVSGQNPEPRKVEDRVFVAVRVAACVPKAPLAPAQTSVAKEEKDEVVKLLVNIENPSDEPIDNVSVSLEGLPEKWSYVSESGFVVPAQSNKTLQVLVKRTTDEEAANVLLKIKSGDKVIGVQEIPRIQSRASGITGFFVAAGSNAWIIALIIIIALAVIVLSGRFSVGGQEKQDEVYASRLRSLKKQISGEGEAEQAEGSAANKENEGKPPADKRPAERGAGAG